jgi:hypothetical protein
MRKRPLLLSMMLFVLLMTSCSTTADIVPFSELIAPPQRPALSEITQDNAIKQLGINLTSLIAHIESWEAYQEAEDAYYRKILENSEK